MATTISPLLTASPDAIQRFAAMRNAKFRIYWLGSLTAALGDVFDHVIRYWLIWEMTGSPFWLGMAGFCHGVPATLVGLQAGVLADRVDNRKLIGYAQFFYMGSAAVMALLIMGDALELWMLLGLFVVHGTAGAVSQPSRQVLVHDIVGRAALLNAVSFSSSTRHSVTIIGPPLAAWTLLTVGPGWGFVVTTVLFIPMVIAISVIRVDASRRTQAPQAQSTWRSLLEGLSYVRAQPLLLGILTLLTTTMLLIGHSWTAMLPYFADVVFQSGATGYSFLLSAHGAGAILGALVLTYVRAVSHKGRLVIASVLAYACSIILFALGAGYLSMPVAACLLVIGGMASVAYQATANTVLQLGSDDAIRGRVMGIHAMATHGLQVFNGPALGGLAVLLGVPAALTVLAAAIVGMTIVIAVKVPGVRGVD